MKMRMQHVAVSLLCCAAMLYAGCGLFEPREAEPPSQSGFQYLPRTLAANVLFNLQKAIEQKDVAGYIACFTDSLRSRYTFTFIPSADAAEIYGAILNSEWTISRWVDLKTTPGLTWSSFKGKFSN